MGSAGLEEAEPSHDAWLCAWEPLPACSQPDNASPAPLISPLNDPLIDSVQSFEINQAVEVAERTRDGSSVRPAGRAFISILSVGNLTC